MTQFTINIEKQINSSTSQKVLSAIEGVSIVKSSTKKKCDVEEAS